MKENLKKLQKIESKERILNVASRLFKKNGFTATGIDQIMEEAGLTAGAFYAHFKSKTDLLEQSIEHSFKFSRHLLLKDTEHLQGEEKIRTIMSRYISTTHRDLPEKGCMIPALASEIYRGSNKSSELIGKYVNKWAELMIEHITRDVTYEEKKEIALNLISQAVGTILLSRMVNNSKLSDEILVSSKNYHFFQDLNPKI
ncbi:TetR/AcrR family transcriptional regulator [bacterium]|nr:TetR/AcrR family transcriptional regulator [bacterium]